MAQGRRRGADRLPDRRFIYKCTDDVSSSLHIASAAGDCQQIPNANGNQGQAMRLETAQFIVTGCVWNFRATRESTDSRNPAMRRNGIKTVSLTCRTCTSVWVATKGEDYGQFRPAISAIHVTCPNGETEGQIALDTLW